MKAISIIAVLLFAGVVNCWATDKPYRVGVIIPLSGQVASMGGYVRNGMDLAIKDLPPELWPTRMLPLML
jgi:ABC-type branched-subunit amino acid transport system substrate-binding protein